MIINLKKRYNMYIRKQKYFLYNYKILKAPDFLIKIQEKLANISFVRWLLWKLKSKIKYFLKNIFINIKNK